MGGYAGTGKSTLISVLAHDLPYLRIAYCAFTGKAANVLRQKLAHASVPVRPLEDYCGTVHSLIYIPQMVNGELIGWSLAEELDYDLIIVDEASMVDEQMFKDLSTYRIPILAVGDHGQLPPIGGSFNLMDKPDIRLETIHRQAESSPILRLSSYIRTHGSLPDKYADDGMVRFVHPRDTDSVLSELYVGTPVEKIQDCAVLCYRNSTRVTMNNRIRLLRFQDTIDAPPHRDDQFICLRNAYGVIYNGMRGIASVVEDHGDRLYRAYIDFPDDHLEVDGGIFRYQFNREKTISGFDDVRQFEGFYQDNWYYLIGLLFDYGYCLTVHKAQGSQYEQAVIIYERGGGTSDEFQRWLYTAATRASGRLTFIVR